MSLLKASSIIFIHCTLYLRMYVNLFTMCQYMHTAAGLYITFYLLGIGSYAVATMPYSGLLADMTHPTLRGYHAVCVLFVECKTGSGKYMNEWANTLAVC